MARNDDDLGPDVERLLEKLQRTLGLVVLLHVKVTDLLMTLSGEDDATARDSLELLRRSKLELRDPE